MRSRRTDYARASWCGEMEETVLVGVKGRRVTIGAASGGIGGFSEASLSGIVAGADVGVLAFDFGLDPGMYFDCGGVCNCVDGGESAPARSRHYRLHGAFFVVLSPFPRRLVGCVNALESPCDGLDARNHCLFLFSAV